MYIRAAFKRIKFEGNITDKVLTHAYSRAAFFLYCTAPKFTATSYFLSDPGASFFFWFSLSLIPHKTHHKHYHALRETSFIELSLSLIRFRCSTHFRRLFKQNYSLGNTTDSTIASQLTCYSNTRRSLVEYLAGLALCAAISSRSIAKSNA